MLAAVQDLHSQTSGSAWQDLQYLFLMRSFQVVNDLLIFTGLYDFSGHRPTRVRPYSVIPSSNNEYNRRADNRSYLHSPA